MKKQLQMKRMNEKLIVTEGEKELFAISADNSISGEVLYNSLFCSMLPTEDAEIEVTKVGLTDKKDVIIFSRFKDLIDKICKAINSSNNKDKTKENEETDTSACPE